MKKHSPLSIATCQFATTSDIRRNAAHIRRQMKRASDLKADVAHFCEAALSGYAGTEFHSWKGFDWALLRAETERIQGYAAELGIWVVLGSAHPLGERHLPHNALHVIDVRGRLIERYDKRFCTAGDLKYYSPGNHFSVFSIKGVSCGLLVCYDVRFPELYRAYKGLGVQCLFHSFWNAGTKGPNIHTIIMRPSIQAHAATNAVWISACNSSVRYQSWPSIFVNPDGRIAQSLQTNKSGVMVNPVDLQVKFYDASKPYREKAMRGILHSGRAVQHPRSRDRHSL